jgi:hypothetical protein
MDEVGGLQPGDLARATVDRRVAHYLETFELARLLLDSSDLTWKTDDVDARAWLLPTPLLIQRGICSILDAGLRPGWRVRARRLALISPPGRDDQPGPGIRRARRGRRGRQVQSGGRQMASGRCVRSGRVRRWVPNEPSLHS